MQIVLTKWNLSMRENRERIEEAIFEVIMAGDPLKWTGDTMQERVYMEDLTF